jgi:hypothetical protein
VRRARSVLDRLAAFEARAKPGARFTAEHCHHLGDPLLYRFLVFVLAIWSGFFVMAIEILSGRILAPNFGNSIYVWGGVITIFMLALSLGYLLGGRWSRVRPSLRRLASILLAAALAISPVAIAADRALDAVFNLIQDPRYGSLLAATLLFFIPTTLSGMVSPYAIRLLVRDSETSGQDAGLLYFASTFGSAAGTLATAFYLVLWFDVDYILWVLLGISVALSLCCFLWNPPRDR